MERVDVALEPGRHDAELAVVVRRRDLPVAHPGHARAFDVDAGHERARADLILGGGPADPLGHPVGDDPGALRRVEQLDDEGRVAMLAPRALRVALAQRRDDDLRERDVRDAVLREGRGELRRRDAPHLLRVGAEEHAVEGAAHRLHHPVLSGHELLRQELAAHELDEVVEERARDDDGRHAARDVERLERVLVVLAAELDRDALRLRGEAVVRDLLEHVEHPLVAGVVGMRPEVVPRPGLAAQRRGESTDEVLRFEDRHAVAVFRELEAGGEPTDAAAQHHGVGHASSLSDAAVRRHGGRGVRPSARDREKVYRPDTPAL